MKVGFSLEPIKGLPLNIIIRLLKGSGLNHFEFNWRIMPRVTEVLESLNRTTTTFHLPIFNRDHFEFASRVKKYNISIQEIMSFINFNKKKLNITFTLAHSPESSKPDYELMFLRLMEIQTPIVLENVVGQSDEHFMNFYFQAKEYLGKHLAGFALDISHRYVNDWNNWLNIPEKLEKEIKYIHISDCTKTEDLHLPLGQGEMPFREFFSYLKKLKYKGIIMQELKPNGNQAEAIMISGLECVNPFSKFKTLNMKLRRKLLRRILEKKKKEFSHILDLKANEIGYDFV